MSKSKPLVFFGNERLATGVTTNTPLLKSLINNGYNIRAVIVNHAAATSRKTRELEVAEMAAKHGIEVGYSSNTQELLAIIENIKPEAGILAAFGKIIPGKVIDLFPGGIINLHPSLLPIYRGPTPIESAILNGDKQTGVSIMQLTTGMDTGPVYAQTSLELAGNESKQDLANKLGALGADLLISSLPAILSGSLAAKPQDESQATYSKLISKQDGLIDTSKSAEQIEKEVRAYLGWPRSRMTIFSKEVIITRCRIVGSREMGSLVIECGNGYIEILKLIAPGGKEITGEEFLRGYSKPRG